MGFLADINALSVGDQVSVQGPAGQELSLLPQGLGPSTLYSGAEPVGPAVTSPDQLPAPFFSVGQWQASAPGNSKVQPFTAMLSIPNPIQITNYGQVTMVDHTQDLTIAWDPTTYSGADFVTVQLYPQVPFQWFTATAVLCRVPASAGQAIIPAPLLAFYQPSASATLSLSISRKPGTAALFTVGLNDGTSIPSVFRYGPAQPFRRRSAMFRDSLVRDSSPPAPPGRSL